MLSILASELFAEAARCARDEYGGMGISHLLLSEKILVLELDTPPAFRGEFRNQRVTLVSVDNVRLEELSFWAGLGIDPRLDACGSS